MTLIRRTLVSIRSKNWSAVIIELVVVVLGIVPGLQAADWKHH
jgi:hypothetical protein